MKSQDSLPLMAINKLFARLLPGHAHHEGLNPGDVIKCLTAFVFAMIQLVMAMLMLPNDIVILEQHPLTSASWIHFHIGFRVLVITISAVLIYRAVLRQTTDYDFYAFLLAGVAYAIEGSFFNPSYYFALVQVLVGVSWFTTLPLHALLILNPACSIIYSAAVLFAERSGFIHDVAVKDILIATIIATIGGLIAGSFREYWQVLNRKLLDRQLDSNGRLIDLGKHLGIICHDISNLLQVQRMGLAVLASDQEKSSTLNLIDRLSRATEHIITLQKFVLAMSQDDKRDLQKIKGMDLGATFKTLIGDLAVQASPHVEIESCEDEFFCSPAALSFAIVNAVNNSYESNAKYQPIPEAFKIRVKISKAADTGEMTVTVRDNGKGFSEHILDQAFKQKVQTSKPAQGNHYGMGLYNIARYVSFQNGSVAAFNDHGAVLVIKIPQS